LSVEGHLCCWRLGVVSVGIHFHLPWAYGSEDSQEAW
jgi:hypothetical protein